jgi:hypothetical protein
MLKTKQIDLKRQFKAVHFTYKEAMAMHCAECLGFFVDGYEKCTSENCSLLPFFPTKSYTNRVKFIELMKEKATQLDNNESFIEKIGRHNLPPIASPETKKSPVKKMSGTRLLNGRKR